MVVKRLGLLCALFFLGIVSWMGLDLFVRGAPSFYAGYLFETPEDLGRSGGIGPLLINTFCVVGLGVALSTAISLPTALLYTELLSDGRGRRIFHALLDIGVGSPRILWGLFGGAVFGGVLGWGFSWLTGAVTLACLLAPILASGFIAGLESVDPSLRDQCSALGIDRWTTVRTQILPAAKPALLASMALAVGRGFSDAAALFFTVGLAAEIPGSLLDPAATLAVFIFNLLATVPGGQTAAYGAAAVLFTLTLVAQMAIASMAKAEGFAR